MRILNSKEAFEAMMAGRNIMCRAVGELMGFDDLSQFPATIFAMPGYEFCIKVETMELAGITFTKPLTLDDVIEGQEVFLIGSTGTILQGKFIPECEGLVKAIKNGFVQRDGINAQNQLRALHALLGVDGFIQHRTADFKNYLDDKAEPVKKRRSRKTEEPAANDQNSTSNDVEEKTFESQSNIQIIEQGPVTAVEDSLTEEIETDPVKLVEKFTAQIDQFTKADDVLSFRHVFLANGYLDQKDQQHLCKLTEDKLLELDPEQYAPKTEPELSPDEVTEVAQPSFMDQIENVARKQASVESAEHGSAPIDLFYKKKKQVLINRIYDMDSVETLERLAPAIPAAKLLPADHQELLSIYAQRKDALAAETGKAS